MPLLEREVRTAPTASLLGSPTGDWHRSTVRPLQELTPRKNSGLPPMEGRNLPLRRMVLDESFSGQGAVRPPVLVCSRLHPPSAAETIQAAYRPPSHLDACSAWPSFRAAIGYCVLDSRVRSIQLSDVAHCRTGRRVGLPCSNCLI